MSGQREWKPGDVVRATYSGEEKTYFYGRDFRTKEYRWISTEGTTTDAFRLADSTRPLVVIDPDDREQVERLALAYDDAFARIVPDFHSRAEEVEQGDDDAIMQAALREFANPTPPALTDMPMDLGARVVDRDGDVWARDTGSSWGCLSTQSAPQAWMDLVNVCGPLRLAEVQP